MTDEQRERENWYEAAAGFVLPELTDLVPGGGRVEQWTVRFGSVYFDTEQHDLLAHGVTLRCLTGETDAGWQLTVPAGDTRTEIRIDPTGSHTSVPKELTALVAGVRRGRSVRHIVTVHTDRSMLRLLHADDQVIVEVADDRIDAIAPGPGAATLPHWREIEVVLGPAGDADLLTALDTRLARAGANVSPNPNEVARALGVPGGDASADHSRARTSGEVIGGYLADQDDALITGDLTLRRGLGGIHSTRVAARRLRSTLRIFADYFDPDRAQTFDTELSWYAALLGEVRDCEVQRARFAKAIAELPEEQVLGPVAARIEQYLLTEQLHHQKILDEAMSTKRYFALLKESGQWLTDPPLTAAGQDKPAKLRSAVRAADRKVTKHLTAGLGQGGTDEALHKARKAAKRARYAAELAQPVFQKEKAKNSIHRYQELQDILGDHQDSVGAAALLRRIAASTTEHPDENGFTYGLLFAGELHRAEHSRRLARSWDPHAATL